MIATCGASCVSLRIESAPAQQRLAHDLEVILAADQDKAAAEAAFVCTSRCSIAKVVGLFASPFSGTVPETATDSTPGRRAISFMLRSQKSSRFSKSLYLREIQTQIRGEHAIHFHARIDVLQLQKTPRRQRRADQQRHGDRHLANDEQPAQATAVGPAPRAPSLSVPKIAPLPADAATSQRATRVSNETAAVKSSTGVLIPISSARGRNAAA